MIMRHHFRTIARGIDPRPYPQQSSGPWDPELSWQADALCAQVDPETFFPATGGRHSVAARDICKVCPVKTDCLEYALVHHEQWGIWGGLGEHERRALRKKASA